MVFHIVPGGVAFATGDRVGLRPLVDVAQLTMTVILEVVTFPHIRVIRQVWKIGNKKKKISPLYLEREEKSGEEKED